MDEDNGVGCPPLKKVRMTEETMLGDESSSIVSQAIKESVLVENNNSFVCQVCKSSMTGIAPAKSHLQGARHKKAVQVYKMEPDVQAAVKSGLVVSSGLGTQVVFTCVPCKKTCSGEMPLMQHLTSEVHAKKLRQEGLSSSSPKGETKLTITSTLTAHYDSASPTDMSPNQDVRDAISSGLVLPEESGNQKVLRCVPCNKSCSGDVPMMQHLTSEVHAKKLRLGVQSSNFSSQKEVPITSAASTIQYSLGSPVDIQSVQDVQDAIRSGIVTSEEVGNWKVLRCVPCNKSCSGNIPMMQHLTSEVHAKKLKQEAHNSNFSSEKEIPITSSASTTQSSLGSLVDIHSVQEDELTQAKKEGTIKAADYDANHICCLVCNVNCTGEDSMKEHLQGKNHLKMQKLTKQTSRQSLGSSPVSSPSHSNASQDSPSLPKDCMTYMNQTISSDMAPDLQEFPVECGAVLKKEGVYECIICKVTCNSYTQITEHLQGEPHKKQCGLRMEDLLVHQLLPSLEMEATLDSTNIIPPPPQFKDPTQYNSPTTRMVKSKGLGGNCKRGRRYSKPESNKKQPSKKLMRLLPDIRIYLSKDPLTDLFDE